MERSYIKHFTICAALIFAPCLANAAGGPFGVEMGADPIALGCKAVDKAGFYHCDTLPKPHSAFEFYFLKSTAATGVCWVKGIGRDVPTNSAGQAIRAKIDELSEQISLTYGKAEPTDWLMSGSIWDKYEDWMMALAKDERIYSFTWEKPGKNNLESVYLAASATSSQKAYPVAEFSFTNKDACDEILKKAEADSF